MAFCRISENCKTCSFSKMNDFVVKFCEMGFTKSEMKKELGDAFCEHEWRTWVGIMNRMMSPTYHFVRELGKWYQA